MDRRSWLLGGLQARAYNSVSSTTSSSRAVYLDLAGQYAPDGSVGFTSYCCCCFTQTPRTRNVGRLVFSVC